MTNRATHLPGFSAEATLYLSHAHYRTSAAGWSGGSALPQGSPMQGEAGGPGGGFVRALAAPNPCAVLATCCALGNPACCQAFYQFCICLPRQICCAAGNPACCRAHWKICVCPELQVCCAGGNWLCCLVGRWTC
jgi:hypothetical protein